MNEVIELVEKAINALKSKWDFPDVEQSVSFLNQALALLKAKPEAGEFTKKLREDYKAIYHNYEYLGASQYAKDIYDACDIIDRRDEKIEELGHIIANQDDEIKKLEAKLAKRLDYRCSYSQATGSRKQGDH